MADVIEDVEIDVDGGYGDDGRTVKAFLKLTGDFVASCTFYLSDPNESTITLELPRSVAEDLLKSLNAILWP